MISGATEMADVEEEQPFCTVGKAVIQKILDGGTERPLLGLLRAVISWTQAALTHKVVDCSEAFPSGDTFPCLAEESGCAPHTSI